MSWYPPGPSEQHTWSFIPIACAEPSACVHGSVTSLRKHCRKRGRGTYPAEGPPSTPARPAVPLPSGIETPGPGPHTGVRQGRHNSSPAARSYKAENIFPPDHGQHAPPCGAHREAQPPCPRRRQVAGRSLPSASPTRPRQDPDVRPARRASAQSRTRWTQTASIGHTQNCPAALFVTGQFCGRRQSLCTRGGGGAATGQTARLAVPAAVQQHSETSPRLAPAPQLRPECASKRSDGRVHGTPRLYGTRRQRSCPAANATQ